jgi:hypothetical protein
MAHRRAMIGRRSEKASGTPLNAKIEQMLTEARVVLPGAQALFGFQLAIVLTQSFEQLPSASRIIHAVAIFLVALSAILLIAPAAYHRIVYAGEDTQDMHRVSGMLVTAATVQLALGMAYDVYVVIAKIAGSTDHRPARSDTVSSCANWALACVSASCRLAPKPPGFGKRLSAFIGSSFELAQSASARRIPA